MPTGPNADVPPVTAGPDLSTISVDSALQNAAFAASLLAFKALANDWPVVCAQGRGLPGARGPGPGPRALQAGAYLASGFAAGTAGAGFAAGAGAAAGAGVGFAAGAGAGVGGTTSAAHVPGPPMPV